MTDTPPVSPSHSSHQDQARHVNPSLDPASNDVGERDSSQDQRTALETSLQGSSLDRCATISRQVEAPKSHPTSVASLPDDILLELFTTIAEESDFCNIRSDQDPSLVLSHVCSRWRTLAVESPTLWTKIMVHDTPTTDIHQATACLELWLSRSYPHPIDLKVYVENSTDGQDPEEGEAVAGDLLALIRSSTPRWRSAWLDIYQSDDIGQPRYQSLLDYDPAFFPQLEELTLMADARALFDAADEDSTPSIFSTPSLRNFSTFVWLDHWRAPASWVHLTDLDLTDLSASPLQALQILVVCSNLNTFSFTSCYEGHYHPAEINLLDFAGAPVKFGQLRLLWFNTTRASPLLLASGLEAPVLSDLTLMGSDRSGWTTEQKEGLGLEARRYVEAFGVQLTRVALHECVPDDSGLLKILDGLVHVEDLTISENAEVLTCGIFALLTLGGEQRWEDGTQDRKVLCPNLQKLGLNVVEGVPDNVEQRTASALALLEGRARHGIHLWITADCWTIMRLKGLDCRDAEREAHLLSGEEREMFDEMDASKTVLDQYVGGSRLEGIEVRKRERYPDPRLRYDPVWRKVEHSLVYQPCS